MTALGEALLGTDAHIELGVATTLPGSRQTLRFSDGRATYFAFVEPRLQYKMRRAGVLSWEPVLRGMLEFIETFRPDVIVVHGTELGHGLIAARTNVPVIISLQGLLGPYAEAYWGEIRNPLRRLFYPGSMRGWLSFLLASRNERRILASAKYFTGRTLWDYSQVLQYHDSFDYFDEPRALRAPFYASKWSLEKVARYTILTSTTAKFLKGSPTLLRAVHRLRRTFPAIRLQIAGRIPDRDAGGYIRKLVKSLDLESNVEFLGHVNADALSEHLERAHVFCLPSHIENSPNSLAEAQMVGTPVVASAVGGVTDMVQHKRSGLLYADGDDTMLAAAIRQVFESDALAQGISSGARQMAAERNDRHAIAEAHIAMCAAVIDKARLL